MQFHLLAPRHLHFNENLDGVLNEGLWIMQTCEDLLQRVLMGVPNYQLTTNFSANCQLTTIFLANCQLTTNFSYLLTFIISQR